jgi:hypothetical protein
MTQRLTAADLGALAIDHPVEGTARIDRVVQILSDDTHIMRLRVTNSTGDRWVWLNPCVAAHRTLQAGDLIHARFTTYGGHRRLKTWVTGLRVCVDECEGYSAVPEPDVFRALERSCRTNRRLVVHSLALMALAGDTMREGAFIDIQQAKEQVLGAIRLLPRNEAHLLARTAAALQL